MTFDRISYIQYALVVKTWWMKRIKLTDFFENYQIVFFLLSISIFNLRNFFESFFSEQIEMIFDADIICGGSGW